MIKKTLILADQDEVYLANLSNYFMEKAPQLELVTFTRGDKLKQYLESENNIDILAVDEGMLSSLIPLPSLDCARIVLSASMTPVDDFTLVKKYQKTETLLNDLLLKYAETTGEIEAIRGKSNTKIVAFYSPAGGTGKTTLALAMATVSAMLGKKVLYLNMEEIDSTFDVFPASAGSLSDIYLAIKTKGMNVGIKLSSSVGTATPGGFCYISGVESVAEHEEIEENEFEKLITAIRALADYDLVILDLSSAFTAKNRKLLLNADVIYVPVLADETSIAKMKRLLRESDYHEVYNPLFARMKLLVNRSMTNSPSPELLNSGLFSQLECAAVIPNLTVFASRKACLSNGEMFRQIMEPVLQIVDAL